LCTPIFERSYAIRTDQASLRKFGLVESYLSASFSFRVISCNHLDTPSRSGSAGPLGSAGSGIGVCRMECFRAENTIWDDAPCRAHEFGESIQYSFEWLQRARTEEAGWEKLPWKKYVHGSGEWIAAETKGAEGLLARLQGSKDVWEGAAHLYKLSEPKSSGRLFIQRFPRKSRSVM